MLKITDKLTQVRNSIQVAAQSCHRNPSDITLLAVSKRHPTSAIVEAFNAGQQDFGENYLQEALEKINNINDLPINWHFIGQIQSNKTKAIAEHFSWVHTLEKVKTAKRLSQQRPEGNSPLNVCIQVNIDNAPNKGGCTPEQLHEIARDIAQLPRIRLRGLMAIPEPGNSVQAFKELKALFDGLNTILDKPLDTLSMGMSGDLKEAVQAGSTCVRVGTAIFGPRKS